jgi:hypothetical protein
MILLEYRGLHETGTVVAVWDSHNQALIRQVPNTPEYYERYYYRTEVNTLNNDGTQISPAPTQSVYSYITSKQHYLKTDGSSPDGYPNNVSNHFSGSRELGMSSQGAADCLNGGCGSTNDTPNLQHVPLLDNQWYCIETHIKMNTPNVADGNEEIWIDGVQTMSYPRTFRDGNHATAALTQVTVYRQASDYMNRYEDDYVLATTRVGCSGVIDITPPSKPQGFTLHP